jgi:phenylalanyl-tRNA synthetase beta chain
VLEGLATRLGVTTDFEQTAETFLHPGRAAKVLVGGEEAGWIGEVHPLVAREWDLEAAVAFELELSVLVGVASAGEETFEDVTAFPAVRQDLAVVVPDEVSAARLRDAVLAGGGELLHGAEVFDLFAGEQLGEGRKSLALRLEFRAADRTLTDEEVADLRVAIERELTEIGGELRG